MKISKSDPGKLAARRGHAWLVTGLFGFGTLLFLAGGPLLPPAQAQWNYDVTLTGYPQARWKALTNYIDKPALADINQDGRPEIIGAGVFGDVYCVDGRTGQILWTYDEERSLELAVYVSPAVADLNCDNVADVVSIAPQGKVFALDGTNGKKLWSFQAEGMVVYSPGAFDIDRNGTVEISVVDTKGNLYVLSSSGKQLWKVTGQSPFFGVPAMGLVGDKAVVIAGDRSGSLRCYDATNGNPLWSYSVSSSPSSSSPISTSPVLFKDPQSNAMPWRVLVGSEKGEVHLVNAQDGQMIWSRAMTGGIVGDFAVGDLRGSGALDAAFSTSHSEVIAVSLSDGKTIWTKKFKVPLQESSEVKRGKRITRETLSGQPVLVDVDGDSKLDVILETRGLNSYVYCLGGSDGRIIWNYGTKNLRSNPRLTESVTIAPGRDELAGDQVIYSDTVPVYSNPTPLVGDFDGDGKADLIVNDRDEVGLINVPLPSALVPGSWAKFASSPCNNMILFSVPCVGAAPAPGIRLSADRNEIVEGQSVKICWTSTNAAGVEMDQGVGAVGVEDCLTVTPPQTTTWTAVARGCGGEAKDSASITVSVKPPAPPPIPPPPPSPPSMTDADREALTRSLNDVFFEYDYYRLTPDAQKTLDQNVKQLASYSSLRLGLEATCDERGSQIYNQFLAVARGESVREYLVAHGVDVSKLEVRPQGETVKWDSRRDEEGWAKNRRVHFVILP